MSDLERCKCPVCGYKEASKQENYGDDCTFYICPVCGRFEIQIDLIGRKRKLDYNKLAAYLVYNKFEHSDSKRRYHTNRDKEWCDKWSGAAEKGDYTHGRPVFLSEEIIENWYPKSFSEKIDKILVYLDEKCEHIGSEISMKREELSSILFVDRYDYKNGNQVTREEASINNQSKYMIEYLKSNGYIFHSDGMNWWEDENIKLKLNPEGYFRIDEFQKNSTGGRNAFIAMQFGENTIKLREAIRNGIEKAGYNAILIDEVQHNEFITPELLKYIRDSKFVVVDLTHGNNGAYFEEGYAMGIGKPVIQLCKKDETLHFDIAQKNTIMWEKEEEIPLMLENRIKATIE